LSSATHPMRFAWYSVSTSLTELRPNTTEFSLTSAATSASRVDAEATGEQTGKCSAAPRFKTLSNVGPGMESTELVKPSISVRES
jgi:hypothetical protein